MGDGVWAGGVGVLLLMLGLLGVAAAGAEAAGLTPPALTYQWLGGGTLNTASMEDVDTAC